jgi:hypothetical protein
LDQALIGPHHLGKRQPAGKIRENDWLPAVIPTAEATKKLIAGRCLVRLYAKQEMLAPPDSDARALPETKFASTKLRAVRKANSPHQA